MAKNLEELRQENPELAAQLEAEAREAVEAEAAAGSDERSAIIAGERKRMQEIDELAHLFGDETVNEAKYGDTACSAQEMAYRAAQKAAQQGKSFLNAMESDTKDSNAQDVEATGTGAEPKEADDREAAIAQAKADAAKYMQMKEGK